jgi:hypothetical protein
MLAVLEDGVETYRSHALAERRADLAEFRRAAEWIRRNDERWPFSFVNVCHTLGLDPAFIRRGLRRGLSSWRAQQALLPAGEGEPVWRRLRRMNGSRTRATGEAPGLRRTG